MKIEIEVKDNFVKELFQAYIESQIDLIKDDHYYDDLPKEMAEKLFPEKEIVKDFFKNKELVNNAFKELLKLADFEGYLGDYVFEVDLETIDKFISSRIDKKQIDKLARETEIKEEARRVIELEKELNRLGFKVVKNGHR